MLFDPLSELSSMLEHSRLLLRDANRTLNPELFELEDDENNLFLDLRRLELEKASRRNFEGELGKFDRAASKHSSHCDVVLSAYSNDGYVER